MVATTPEGITRLIVERVLVDRKRPEELRAVEMAHKLGIPAVIESQRGLRRHEVDSATLCVGSVDFIRAAVARAGAVLPAHVPYPAALSPWMHRAAGRAPMLRDLLRQRGRPTFVKPADGWKRFTGRVLHDLHEAHAQQVSVNQPVWWSEPVAFQSEWRAYCAEGFVLDLQRCPHTAPDGPTVDGVEVAAAASALYRSRPDLRGVVIDFGTLGDGRTSLIEVNDGFSFGAYGTVLAEVVWRVWAARWPGLIGNARISGPEVPVPGGLPVGQVS